MTRLQDFLKVHTEAARKEKQKEWKAKSRQKQRENNNQKVKDCQNKYKVKSRTNQREEDSQKVKDYQSKYKVKSRATQREVDNQKVRNDENRWTCLNRKKHKLEDPKALSAYEKEAQKKKRRLWNASDILKEFMEATKYNAIFICSCCHRRLFYSNVEVITDRLKSTINEKKPGHFRD